MAFASVASSQRAACGDADPWIRGISGRWHLLQEASVGSEPVEPNVRTHCAEPAAGWGHSPPFVSPARRAGDTEQSAQAAW